MTCVVGFGYSLLILGYSIERLSVQTIELQNILLNFKILTMQVVDFNQLKPIIAKSADFFADKKRFKSFHQDIEKDQIKDITDVDLQCLGYGHFEPDQLLDRFEKYTIDIIKSCRGIKVFKITLNGFDLYQNRILKHIAEAVETLKDSIKTLAIHTSHLTNCEHEDFQSILSLSFKMGSINFQQISLQFSFWKFALGPPQFTYLEKTFRGLLTRVSGQQISGRQFAKQLTGQFSMLEYKKFRLQISGWYYDLYEAKWFLNFALTDKEIDQNELTDGFGDGYELDDDSVNQAVDIFHNKMHELTQGLLQLLKNIQQFEMDFRNWHEFLKMKNLKKKLDNIKKDNTFEKSLVSKRQQYVEGDEKELRMLFVM